MKFLYATVLALFSATTIHAQVSITTADLPQPDDVLTTRDAVLLDPNVDLEATGEDFIWNFGFDILQPGNNVTEIICVDVDDTPIAYQFLFNNPFDPTHNSDFAYGVDEFGAGNFTFEDAYFYFQNNNQHYVQTGAGCTINGVPVGAQGDPVDVIYELPLDYGDVSSSDSQLNFEIPTLGAYGLTQTRSNEVVGWGTLNIYDQSFQALLVRTEIESTDSIYIEFIQFGQSIERPLTVEYKWLSLGYNVPILQINTAGGIVTTIATADIYTGVNEIAAPTIQLFPNPANQIITITGSVNASNTYIIRDLQGREVLNGTLGGNRQIDISSLAPSSYVISIVTEQGIVSKTFNIER